MPAVSSQVCSGNDGQRDIRRPLPSFASCSPAPSSASSNSNLSTVAPSVTFACPPTCTSPDSAGQSHGFQSFSRFQLHQHQQRCEPSLLKQPEDEKRQNRRLFLTTGASGLAKTKLPTASSATSNKSASTTTDFSTVKWITECGSTSEHPPGTEVPLARMDTDNASFIICKSEVVVGRHSHHQVADIRFDDNSYVSRAHFVLRFGREDGQWRLLVNGKNGIFVDSALVRRCSTPTDLPNE